MIHAPITDAIPGNALKHEYKTNPHEKISICNIAYDL